MKENLQLFDDFKTWCRNMGENESNADTLSLFVKKMEHGDIVKCDCCGEWFDEEHRFEARYDDVYICPDCHYDGN